MAYQTYITNALVCGTRESNTSDRLFTLFTRDAGMVFAHAKSVREEKSKHRYALQPFSHVRVTLVRGKSGWKITGTEPVQNFFSDSATRETRAFLRNIVLLLRRVMQGETAHPEVFDDVILACGFLGTHDSKKLELILTLRILNTLGYVASKPAIETLLQKELSAEVFDQLSSDMTKECREIVEYALQQSQL